MARQSLVSIMIRQLGLTSLLALGLILYSQPGWGTSGNVTNGGVFLKGAAHDTGVREWVKLVKIGEVLSAWPKHPLIALITVYAPGVDGDHLILRELDTADGKKSLLPSAPAFLVQKTRRVTLYIEHHDEHMVLLEYQEGRWRRRKPQPMRVASEADHGTSQDHLLAFTAAGLGLYWLTASREPGGFDVTGTAQEPSASALVGGGMSRGLLPWVCSVLLLLVGWVISRWLHQIEERTEK